MVKNGDGKISTTELKDAMKRLGQNPSDSDVQAMIKQVDKGPLHNVTGVIC
jgi:Ca2+-binding EF-hand superfamily protein